MLSLLGFEFLALVGSKGSPYRSRRGSYNAFFAMNSIVLPPSNKRKASFIVSTTIEVAGESSYFFWKEGFFQLILSFPLFFLYIRGGVVRTCQSKCLEPFCSAAAHCVLFAKALDNDVDERTTPRERERDFYFFILQKMSLQHDTHCTIHCNCWS